MQNAKCKMEVAFRRGEKHFNYKTELNARLWNVKAKLNY
jgi:hypothetical protein